MNQFDTEHTELVQLRSEVERLSAENRDLKSALIAIAEVEVAMNESGVGFSAEHKLAVAIDIAKGAAATCKDIVGRQ